MIEVTDTDKYPSYQLEGLLDNAPMLSHLRLYESPTFISVRLVVKTIPQAATYSSLADGLVRHRYDTGTAYSNC